MFHGYQRGTPPEEIDADMKRIIEAKKTAFVLQKENRNGKTESILPMPGLVLEVGHFYGKNDVEADTALVTASRLHVRAMWPRDLVALPIGGDPGEAACVEFAAKTWGKDTEKRFAVSHCGRDCDGGERWN